MKHPDGPQQPGNTMKLHFDPLKVVTLLDHTKAAPKHCVLYDDPTTAKPGLWLVGDEGIYLMSNGEPPLLVPDQPAGTTKNVIAYAREADPTKLDSATWWAAKRDVFSGSDGAEFLDAGNLLNALKTYRPGADLIIELTEASVGIIIYEPVAPNRPANRPTGRQPRNAR